MATETYTPDTQDGEQVCHRRGARTSTPRFQQLKRVSDIASGGLQSQSAGPSSNALLAASGTLLLDKPSARESRPQRLGNTFGGAQTRRVDELQDCFTSKHANRCEQLRAKLAMLDEQAATLKRRLETLECELQDASAERTARRGSRHGIDDGALVEEGRPFEGSSAVTTVTPLPIPLGIDMETASVSGDVSRVRSTPVTQEDLQPPRPSSANDSGSIGSGEASAPRSGRTSGVGNPDIIQLHGSQVSPILTRRRAEARFREATALQDNAMKELRAHALDLERRIHKQQHWMRQVDKKVLEAEIARTKYTVRLEHSERRVKSLGEELSKAYERMSNMLEERMKYEDIGARNDALLTYMDVIGKADKAQKITDSNSNKDDLKQVLEKWCQHGELQSQYQDLMEQCRDKLRLVRDVMTHSAKIEEQMEQLYELWCAVPVALKESIFFMVPNSRMTTTGMHPATAIQHAQRFNMQIHAAQQACCHMLESIE